MRETVELSHLYPCSGCASQRAVLGRTEVFGAKEHVLFFDISASQPREGETVHPPYAGRN